MKTNPFVTLFVLPVAMIVAFAVQTARADSSYTSKESLSSRPRFSTDLRREGIAVSFLPGAAISLDQKPGNGSTVKFDHSFISTLRFEFTFHRSGDWAFALQPEYSFYNPSFEIRNVTGVSGVNLTGDLDIHNFGMNLIGKYNLSQDWQFYLGSGFFISHSETNNARVSAAGTALTSATGYDDTTFGLQPIIGVRYFFEKNWALSLEERFMWIHDVDYVGSSVQSDIETFTTSLGLSYHF